jgi:hypothetical protein
VELIGVSQGYPFARNGVFPFATRRAEVGRGVLDQDAGQKDGLDPGDALSDVEDGELESVPEVVGDFSRMLLD